MIKLFSIGVYGFTEDEFFNSLINANIDTFCDIRRRRGVRGAKYAFANSNRLQEKLEKLGIRYCYFKGLAPSNEIREKQIKMDKLLKVQKRLRDELHKEFVDAYKQEILNAFDADEFFKSLGSDSKNIVLFCVERKPEACHRSIVTDFLSNKIKDIQVIHL